MAQTLKYTKQNLTNWIFVRPDVFISVGVQQCSEHEFYIRSQVANIDTRRIHECNVLIIGF